MRFVNMLNAKTAHIYQKNTVASLVEANIFDFNYAPSWYNFSDLEHIPQ